MAALEIKATDRILDKQNFPLDFMENMVEDTSPMASIHHLPP